jgi:type VI secretion system secreted protein VgrG
MRANLEVHVASGDSLDVRRFKLHERMSAFFEATAHVVCENASVDFDAIVGQPASFTLGAREGARTFHGLCRDFRLVRVEEEGLTTYELSVVPTLWLLTQRRNHRMFQQVSELEIVIAMLAEWGIEPIVELDAGAYKKRKYRVQYGESDYDFIRRMMEDVGISFFFREVGGETKMVLSDAPQQSAPRDPAIRFADDPSPSPDQEWVTRLEIGQRVRPGRFTVRDHDYRRPPAYPLVASAEGGLAAESRLERFHYEPGAFLFRADRGDDTPHADDRGKARHDEREGATLATRRLAAKRSAAKRVTFETNVFALAPGVVTRIADHPRSDITDGAGFLVLDALSQGEIDDEWTHRVEVVSASLPYHPPPETTKPKVQGVESATVVGPPGEEIHTDEFGRVRVHFHWDRESRMDDNSSCWIHVSQPWGGAGYGGMNLPRIGQEVLVDFLGGDPDRPVIVGRVFTNLQKVPYGLPANKTQSGWKSNSTNRTGGYNEIMFEDSAGRELVRMQAERDRDTLVKRNSSTTIGNDRTITVVRNDTETVRAAQTIEVVDNRQITVHGEQRVVVDHDHVVYTPETYASGAKQHQFVSEEIFVVSAGQGIRLQVGEGSFIQITAEGIVIQAPRVDINPE